MIVGGCLTFELICFYRYVWDSNYGLVGFCESQSLNGIVAPPLISRLPCEVLFGSVMHLLVHTMMPSNDPNVNLTTLWADIRVEYRKNSTVSKFTAMKMTMFNAKGGVKLRGTAAIIKAFGPIIYDIFLRYKKDLKVHNLIELCLRTGNELEQILNDNKTEFAFSGIAPMFVLVSWTLGLSYGKNFVLCRVCLIAVGVHTFQGSIADTFEMNCSMHFRAFWQLREWARTEVNQLFQLTEKAFNAHYIILESDVYNDPSGLGILESHVE
jgi:hypothetical protein